MKSRKAFTLIELLAVMGILALLAAILLPVINHARRSAEITAQKLDFQTIATALENYRSDFGDYPRNVILPTTPGATTPAFLSLAAALIGPGPGVTMTVNGQIENGDGAFGMGFRSRTMNFPVTWDGTNLDPTGTLPAYVDQQSAWVYVSTSTGNAYGITGITLVGGKIVPLWAPNAVTPPPPLATPPGIQDSIRVATGKVWGPYLPAEKFPGVFVAYVDANGNKVDPNGDKLVPPYAGQPELLDHWGQPIQYFTRFGPSNTRTDSVLTPPAGTTAGPLYGYAVPKSIDNSLNGQNAIWDQRDGAVILDAQKNPAGAWQTAAISNTTPSPPGNIALALHLWPYTPPTSSSPPPPVNLGLAVRWMLGDDNLDNFIDNGETLRYTGPYILISAGPNSTWCNLLGPYPAPYANMPLPEAIPKIFQDSGNIYNFDR